MFDDLTLCLASILARMIPPSLPPSLSPHLLLVHPQQVVAVALHPHAEGTKPLSLYQTQRHLFPHGRDLRRGGRKGWREGGVEYD